MPREVGGELGGWFLLGAGCAGVAASSAHAQWWPAFTATVRASEQLWGVKVRLVLPRAKSAPWWTAMVAATCSQYSIAGLTAYHGQRHRVSTGCCGRDGGMTMFAACDCGAAVA